MTLSFSVLTFNLCPIPSSRIVGVEAEEGFYPDITDG
jgi:hypothetical protein